MKKRTKQRIIFLGASIASVTALITASCSGPIATQITQEQADMEVKKVELSLNNKSNLLASSVTKETPFAKSKYDVEKYDLEIKSITVSTTKNTEINVVIVLKVKNSTIISKEHTVIVSGFKVPATNPQPQPGEKDKETSPVISQKDVNEEIMKILLDVENKSNVLASSISKETAFTKTGYDTKKYDLEIKSVTVSDEINNRINVVIILKAKNPATLQAERTIFISGFKVPEMKPETNSQKEVNEEVKKVMLDVENKADVLASTITDKTTFTQSGFNADKYTLEIKKVSVSTTTNTEVEVVVTLKVKNSQTVSEEHTVKITGFKAPMSSEVEAPAVTKEEADKEVEKVKIDVTNKAEVLASSISKETMFATTEFDIKKYTVEIISAAASENNSVKVVFKLKAIGSTIESKQKEITITGFMAPVQTPPATQPNPSDPQPTTPMTEVKPTQEEANAEVKKVTLSFSNITETLASSVDKNSPFSSTGFETKKYELEIKSVTIAPENNSIINVTFALKVIGTNIVSENRELTISGFKTPPVVLTKEDANMALAKVELNYENKNMQFSSAITATSPFVQTGFDTSKYDLVVKSVTVSTELNTTIKVVVALKVKNSEVESQTREIEITGFLASTSMGGTVIPGPTPGDDTTPVQPTPDTTPTKQDADKELAKVELSFEKAAETLASTLTTSSTFTPTNLDTTKYDLQIKSVMVPDENKPTLKVTFTLKVKGTAAGADIVSNEKVVTITGFKTPETTPPADGTPVMMPADGVTPPAEGGTPAVMPKEGETTPTPPAMTPADGATPPSSGETSGTVMPPAEGGTSDTTMTPKVEEPTVEAKPTKEQADLELEKVMLSFAKASETLASAVTPTSDFTKTGFDEKKYTLEIKTVTAPTDANTTVKVTFTLKVIGADTESKQKELTITGFKAPTMSGTETGGADATNPKMDSGMPAVTDPSTTPTVTTPETGGGTMSPTMPVTEPKMDAGMGTGMPTEMPANPGTGTGGSETVAEPKPGESGATGSMAPGVTPMPPSGGEATVTPPKMGEGTPAETNPATMPGTGGSETSAPVVDPKAGETGATNPMGGETPVVPKEGATGTNPEMPAASDPATTPTDSGTVVTDPGTVMPGTETGADTGTMGSVDKPMTEPKDDMAVVPKMEDTAGATGSVTTPSDPATGTVTPVAGGTGAEVTPPASSEPSAGGTNTPAEMPAPGTGGSETAAPKPGETDTAGSMTPVATPTSPAEGEATVIAPKMDEGTVSTPTETMNPGTAGETMPAVPGNPSAGADASSSMPTNTGTDAGAATNPKEVKPTMDAEAPGTPMNPKDEMTVVPKMDETGATGSMDTGNTSTPTASDKPAAMPGMTDASGSESTPVVVTPSTDAGAATAMPGAGTVADTGTVVPGTGMSETEVKPKDEAGASTPTMGETSNPASTPTVTNPTDTGTVSMPSAPADTGVTGADTMTAGTVMPPSTGGDAGSSMPSVDNPSSDTSATVSADPKPEMPAAPGTGTAMETGMPAAPEAGSSDTVIPKAGETPSVPTEGEVTVTSPTMGAGSDTSSAPSAPDTSADTMTNPGEAATVTPMDGGETPAPKDEATVVKPEMGMVSDAPSTPTESKPDTETGAMTNTGEMGATNPMDSGNTSSVPSTENPATQPKEGETATVPVMDTSSPSVPTPTNPDSSATGGASAGATSDTSAGTVAPETGNTGSVMMPMDDPSATVPRMDTTAPTVTTPTEPEVKPKSETEGAVAGATSPMSDETPTVTSPTVSPSAPAEGTRSEVTPPMVSTPSTDTNTETPVVPKVDDTAASGAMTGVTPPASGEASAMTPADQPGTSPTMPASSDPATVPANPGSAAETTPSAPSDTNTTAGTVDAMAAPKVESEVEMLKKELEKSFTTLEAKITSISADNQSLATVKSAIDKLNAKITEAKAYVATDSLEKSKLETFKTELTTLGEEVDKQVADVTDKLTSLISTIGNSFELKDSGDATTMLPSTITTEKLQFQSAKALEKQTLNFTTEGYDEFGRVLVSGSVKYGDVTQQFTSVPLSIDFKKTTVAYNKFLNSLVKDVEDAKNKLTNPKTIKAEIDAVKDLQAKIAEFLTLTDDKYKEVLSDNVTLYLWAEEASKNKSTDTDTALQTVKTNFIDKPDSATFSKLDYLTKTGATERWGKLEKLIKLFVFANNSKTVPATDAAATANEAELMPYKDSKFVEFIKGFYEDFITKYYTSSTTVTNGKWVLFEFVQPWFTTRMFLLLEKYLTEQQKTKTIETLKRFTNSISHYGSVENTSSTAGMKLIDNFIHFSRNFFVKNWLNLYTQNIKGALKDAQDYKTWIQTIDFQNLTKMSGTTATENKSLPSIMILNYINAIRLQNDFYSELKKTNTDLKFDTVSFENLTNWFLTHYLPTNITFDKATATGGEVLLRIVAVLYLALATNKTQQDAFLASLKTSVLLSGKTHDEFKDQIGKISWPFAKTVWETIILPKS